MACRRGWKLSSAPSRRRAQSPKPSATPSRAGQGLTRFLDDGHVEIDSNVVERTIRPLALNRKNALFAGSDGGGEHWAILASLIETCKLNGVDPQAYLADVFAQLVAGYPINRLEELLPWSWAAAQQTRRAA
jgi:transposase